MDREKLSKFKNGWFVGNFEPTLYKGNFEVAFQKYRKGEHHADHYHVLSKEINLVTRGKIKVNEEIFRKGEFFVLYPYEVSRVEYLTDVDLVVVRTASDPTDKYEVKDDNRPI